MPILNYSTKIRPDRTVAEIQNLLARKGAQRVMIDYESGKITAVVFTVSVAGHGIENKPSTNIWALSDSASRARRTAGLFRLELISLFLATNFMSSR